MIGEIMSDNLIIALNKIDMIPEAEREEKVRPPSAVSQGPRGNQVRARADGPCCIPR